MRLKEIYLDNSASTKCSEEVIQEICKVLKENYGNPSSLHRKGFESKKIIDNTLNNISEFLNCKEEEIYFTSGGTEANNLAIFGAVNLKKRSGNKIITTSIEHDSVLNSCKELEKQGFKVIYLKCDSKGNFNIKEIYNLIDKDTILISMMLVNNELGNILPVDLIKNIIKEKESPALFHVDACQAFGKILIDNYKIDADLMTFTAHKIHGPKGIGALFCKKNVKIKPIFYGGEQQRRIRPGTEALSLIAGFDKALKEIKNNYQENFKKVKILYNYLKEKLKEIKEVKINEIENSSYYILNFSVLNIKSEVLMNFLNENNIFVSSGSACKKNKKSHVLKALNLNENYINSAIRISFCKDNTLEEINEFIKTLKLAIKKLCKVR